MVAIHSSETPVLTKTTRRHIPEDGILHIHRRGNLKSYTALTGWALWRRRNVCCEVRIGFSITKDGIFHSLLRENLKILYRINGPGFVAEN
jgi:hypothetical protein